MPSPKVLPGAVRCLLIDLTALVRATLTTPA